MEATYVPLAASAGDYVLYGLAVVGALAVLAGVLVAIDEWRVARTIASESAGFRFDQPSAPAALGIPILYSADEEVLRSIATQHGLKPPPEKVEKKKRFSLRGGTKEVGAAGDASKTEVIKPPDDLAELVHRMLDHLHREEKMSQAADCISTSGVDGAVSPAWLDQDEAEELYGVWLEARYPEGLEKVSIRELARALPSVGEDVNQAELRDRLQETFRQVKGDGHLLFLEGEWSISQSDDGKLTMTRTDLRVIGRNGEVVLRSSYPILDGISIKAHVEAANLTPRGRARMVGVTQPIRASMIATFFEHKDETGCFEVTPLATFEQFD
jgi:hypothetical protein